MIRTKCVDVSNGDFDNARICCRLVGKDFRTGPNDALYVNSPPLVALRVITSHAATDQPAREKREMMVNDLLRA